MFVGRPNTQLPVECLFSLWIVMHKGGDKLNLNLSIAGLFLQETYTSTDTSWASMQVSSHMHHTGLGLGGSAETECTK